jgi:hypothetical protein
MRRRFGPSAQAPQPTPRDVVSEAQRHLQHFWGDTAGGDADLEALRTAVLGCGLTHDQIALLEVWVPVAPPGTTTHQRCERARLVLRGLRGAS